jgi:hypothetical protein
MDIIFNAGNSYLLLVIGYKADDNRIIITVKTVGAKESRPVTGQFLKG